MKRRSMKKALAAVLSAAMAFSLPASAEVKTVSAEKKFVSLNTSFKTLKAGQKGYKLRLVNNTVGWKIKKAVTSDKTVAAVYGRTDSYVLLKGVAEGRATIKLSLKTSERKKYNTKTLRCRVHVAEAEQPEPQPAPSQDPVETSAVVKTQEELDAVLADAAVSDIRIETEEAVDFTIPEGNHKGVDLTVNTPNSEVTNSAEFKSITIEAISENTWRESGKRNQINVSAPKSHIIVEKGAQVKSLDYTTRNAKPKLEVKGAINALTLNATTNANVTMKDGIIDSMTMKGSNVTANIIGTTMNNQSIGVVIDVTAMNAIFSTGVNTNITLKAFANITIKKGAEKSIITVEKEVEEQLIIVKNDTGAHIPIIRTDGSTIELPGTDSTQSASTDSSSNTNTGSSSDSGGNSPAQGSAGTQGTAGTDGTTGTGGTDSTQGTDGAGGTTGAGGTDSTQGTDGTGGTDSTQGTDGTDGSGSTQGSDGTDGSGGTQGSDGTDGSGGTQGSGSVTSPDALQVRAASHPNQALQLYRANASRGTSESGDSDAAGMPGCCDLIFHFSLSKSARELLRSNDTCSVRLIPLYNLFEYILWQY